MAHTWWRDGDYELSARLTKERDEAKAALEAERAKVAQLVEALTDVRHACPLECTVDSYCNRCGIVNEGLAAAGVE